MRAALRQRIRGWTRPRAPEGLPAQLDRRRIYVLPTASGLFFAALLGAMLLGALNFNNNPGLLLALLLAGAAHTSLVAAHLQLSGLRIEAVSAEPLAAGGTLHLRIALGCTDTRVRRGLRIACGEQAATTLPLLDARGATAELRLPAPRRGLWPLPRLILSSVQPLGLARAWAYVWPAQSLLVYAAPEPQAPPLPAAVGVQGRARPSRSGEDPHHLRDYRSGDALRAVAWKASARHASLLVREDEQQQAGELRLDWQQTAGLPYEQRISRLARWVDEAEREGRRYALALPGQPAIATGHGDAHRHRCQRALALLPREPAHA
ncbi:DUF58 domain-containing protein [Thermomonas sp. S9]|uniref:DUF58 domain-containing protein n=1 Tax=Thermomonas sp. S9 TaxID=2885203 RepID=UPI00216AC669|nr:DUF58 domain-containing protein [Thermomonas sp. S9]MCR6496816.1 DUF58 domain-containing protein [Thermomonas sp. S9]